MTRPGSQAVLTSLSESDVLLIAGNQLADSHPLNDADLTCVRVARLRIFDAKESLHAR